MMFVVVPSENVDRRPNNPQVTRSDKGEVANWPVVRDHILWIAGPEEGIQEEAVLITIAKPPSRPTSRGSPSRRCRGEVVRDAKTLIHSQRKQCYYLFFIVEQGIICG